jgi:hypothetical protein
MKTLPGIPKVTEEMPFPENDQLFKLTEMVMKLDGGHIGHSYGYLLCHKMNTSVFVLS